MSDWKNLPQRVRDIELFLMDFGYKGPPADAPRVNRADPSRLHIPGCTCNPAQLMCTCGAVLRANSSPLSEGHKEGCASLEVPGDSAWQPPPPQFDPSFPHDFASKMQAIRETPAPKSRGQEVAEKMVAAIRGTEATLRGGYTTSEFDDVVRTKVATAIDAELARRDGEWEKDITDFCASPDGKTARPHTPMGNALIAIAGAVKEAAWQGESRLREDLHKFLDSLGVPRMHSAATMTLKRRIRFGVEGSSAPDAGKGVGK